MSKRFLQSTLVNICPLTDLQLCSLIHKDLCTTCCDVFYSSSYLKLTAICATVAQLFDRTWQESLFPCFGGPVLLGFGNFSLLRSLAICIFPTVECKHSTNRSFQKLSFSIVILDVYQNQLNLSSCLKCIIQYEAGLICNYISNILNS